MIINIASEYLGADKATKQKIMDYYNTHIFPLVEPSRKYRIKPNDDWCMAFASVVAHKAKIENFPWEVSTYYALQILEARGVAFTNSHDAKRGDLVFFDWTGNGTPNHVGFVMSVDDDTITTIEGNKGDTVGIRTVNHTSRSLLAFAPTGESLANEHIQRARIETLAWEVIRGVYGNGERRREALGNDYSAVQSMVNQLLKR